MFVESPKYIGTHCIQNQTKKLLIKTLKQNTERLSKKKINQSYTAIGKHRVTFF